MKRIKIWLIGISFKEKSRYNSLSGTNQFRISIHHCVKDYTRKIDLRGDILTHIKIECDTSKTHVNGCKEVNCMQTGFI